MEQLINGLRISDLPLFYEQCEEFDINLLWETPRGNGIELIRNRLGDTYSPPPDMLARSTVQKIEAEGFEFNQSKRPALRM
ncbi:hypothetical protein ACKF11_13120 [Methylobacillus sp. Pita2]|uniref:hypothetical protein n=1 Tax=Methylobacillus sp. Pita2 TaxID=3383245 RepID=UPI0038B5FC8E